MRFSEKLENVKFKSKEILVFEMHGNKITLYPDGKMLIDEKENVQKIIMEIYRELERSEYYEKI